MTQNWQILLPAILAGNFLFLPANSIFHLHLAGKMALWHTMYSTAIQLSTMYRRFGTSYGMWHCGIHDVTPNRNSIIEIRGQSKQQYQWRRWWKS